MGTCQAKSTPMSSSFPVAKRRNMPATPWLCLLLCCCPLAAQAQDHEQAAQDDERSWSLGLALGQGERDNPLISSESIDINAVIDFSWYGERFFFDNGDFGYALGGANTWSLNLIATFNNERNYYNYLTGRSFGLDSVLDNRFGLAGNGPAEPGSEDPRDPGLAAPEQAGSAGLTGLETPEFLNSNTELPDRDFALNSGVEFLYISPFGDVQAQLLTDVSKTHEGQEAWLSWSRPWYTRSSELNLTLGAEWKSHNLIGYYYGVLPEEAFAGRPEYDGASGTNTFIRLAARHKLGRHWNLVGMIEREFLSSAISNSPIVDQDSVDTFFAGLYYQF
jgi:outer membrane protein